MLLNDASSPDRRRRDELRAEAELEEAAGAALRQFLRRLRRHLDGQLTASSLTASVPAVTTLFTIGEAAGWWDEALEDHVTDRVAATFQAGRAATTDLPLGVPALDGMATYVSRVRDRLSRDASPSLPERAFEKVRGAVSEELSLGHGSRQIQQRIGAELAWDEPAGFWRDRLSELDSVVDGKLDAIGPPGDPAREWARLNDPEVSDLQRQRANARLRIDRVESEWQTRGERIARTEANGAYNAGTVQAGAEEGAQFKAWISAADDRTREEHLEASGQCVPFDAEFEVGGEYLQMPGDPMGPAALIVNCRCQMLVGETCEELGAVLETTYADTARDAERERREQG